MYSVQESTSARRRPIRLLDVVSRSIASDGGVSNTNLSSSSIRKSTLDSSSRFWRIEHSCSNFLLTDSAYSLLCFSFWRFCWHQMIQDISSNTNQAAIYIITTKIKNDIQMGTTKVAVLNDRHAINSWCNKLYKVKYYGAIYLSHIEM